MSRSRKNSQSTRFIRMCYVSCDFFYPSPIAKKISLDIIDQKNSFMTTQVTHLIKIGSSCINEISRDMLFTLPTRPRKRSPGSTSDRYMTRNFFHKMWHRVSRKISAETMIAKNSQPTHFIKMRHASYDEIFARVSSRKKIRLTWWSQNSARG
jgi:hypothetical protein